MWEQTILDQMCSSIENDWSDGLGNCIFWRKTLKESASYLIYIKENNSVGGVTPSPAPSLTLDSSIVLANPLAVGADPRQ
jgi:hypothetical protein